jgi:ATP-dependent DNA ligase
MFEPPMRPVDIEELPVGPDWVIERKHDGWRTLAHIIDGQRGLFTRTGNPITQVPYILARLGELVPSGTILDGELVNLAGGPELDRTRSILKRTRNGFQHKPSAQDPPLSFAVFDILALGGDDLRGRELAERKRALSKLLGALPADDMITLIEHQPASETALEEILAAGYEGVVVKHLRSTYLCGVEGGGAWFKIKRELEAEAVLTGFYPADPDSKYARNGNGEAKPWAVGGLCFTVTHPDGREVDGRAAGMDDTLRREMHEHPERFIGLVVEIAHRGIEASGALRNPVFKRLRDTEEKPRRKPATTRNTAKPASSKRAAAAAGKGRALGGKPRMRNYGAMGPENLVESVHSLRNKSGEAYERCLRSGSGDPDADLVVAEKWAREKGLL